MKRKVSSYNCKESEVTDETLFINRRSIIKQLGILGSAPFIINSSIANSQDQKTNHKPNARKLLSYKRDAISNDELTLENKAISHNNFYEFGSQKHQPAELSRDFKVKPWTLSINEGDRSIKLSYDDLLDMFDLEERIYRLRCVEAWSMVIPWIGFPLSKLIEKLNPSSEAKWVRFQTIYNPSQMPGQRNYFLGGGIDYPYVEGLRLDEAMHPLTILAVGLYGKTLPPQNGAPVRLVVPWKYGFKSIKSIVDINLVSKKPRTTWNLLASNEYGFYANVNPEVDHPRWSQAYERRITSGGIFNQKRIKTLPFNGYADEVAHLYKGMNLKKNY
ncbi:MAG: protein-methionine-sulfoxide reductase catalytic subunit MsrP [Porticoccaceae bacterium]|nr:MAG: protein-methionine-sulfoxide reductase catalytic subunit MsrP [Porticoccaceae bacterium]